MQGAVYGDLKAVPKKVNTCEVSNTQLYSRLPRALDAHKMSGNWGWGTLMFKRLFVACGLLTAIASPPSPLAAGPYGTIHVGNWIGGAFSDDSTGAFSHCSAMSSYASGASLVVGQNGANPWLLR